MTWTNFIITIVACKKSLHRQQVLTVEKRSRGTHLNISEINSESSL